MNQAFVHALSFFDRSPAPAPAPTAAKGKLTNAAVKLPPIMSARQRLQSSSVAQQQSHQVRAVLFAQFE
jgi:hypothetical protein